jgi:hypothetical protein
MGDIDRVVIFERLKMESGISINNLAEILPEVCDRETSADPEHWTKENPLWGQCAVVALLIQDLFGGQLIRASLADIPGFGPRDSHYANRLTEGETTDLTADQFGQDYPSDLEYQVREREYVLSYADTARRYEVLSSRLVKRIFNSPE